MKCLYCQKECLVNPALPQNKLEHFDCITESCKAKYSCLRDGGLVSVRWPPFYVKGEQYAIKVYDGVSGNAPEFVIFHYRYASRTANPYQKIIRDWGELVRWGFVPKDWSPKNQEEKLQRMLPFL